MDNSRRKVYVKSLSDNLEVLLPVTPFIDWNEGVNTSSQDLMGFGEIDTGSTPKLINLTLESFFPFSGNNYDFALTTNNTEYYLNFFTTNMYNESKLLLTYCDENVIIRKINCKIIDFQHKEKYGNKDVYYTLKMREYKKLALNDRYSIDSVKIAKEYGSDTYYVGEGDTIINIAAKLYGDSSKWEYLMNKNNLKNPLDLKIGQGLKI